MRAIEWIGIGVLCLLGVLTLLFVRREIIARGRGTVEVAYRLTTLVAGRGWSPGVARFAGDDMRWYRVFSFSPRPRRVLSRRNLAVRGRRSPDAQERLMLPAHWVVLHCTSEDNPVEIAMAATTLTGFLSWVEAAPSGAASTMRPKSR